MRQTLDRAEQFLALAALVAVMLAAVAVALAASRYLRRHLDAAAMMRCLGAPQRQMLALVRVAVPGARPWRRASSAASSRSAASSCWSRCSARVVATDLPPPGWLPAVAAMATGLLLLLGFALPPLFALVARAAAARAAPRYRHAARGRLRSPTSLGAATVALLIGWQAQDVKTGAIMIGGIAALLAAAAALAWCMIALLRLLPQRGYSWRYGLANLRRRPLASSLQIGALGLGLMALLLLTLVRGDLLRNWRASLPPDAPNAFLINVLPDQVDGVRAMLKRELERRAPAVADGARPSRRDQRQASRYREPRRRSARDDSASASSICRGPIPCRAAIASSPVTGGRRASGDGISLEDGIAKTLGIKSRRHARPTTSSARASTRTVTSLRKVDWDSFRVNFFALFSPGALDGMPTTYISAVARGRGQQLADAAGARLSRTCS